MITKETTEEKIIESLKEIKKIMTEHITDVQASIALMQSKTKPFEDYLHSLPSVQLDFHYGNSYAVRTLIDEIKAIQVNN
jgi:signal transduction histidine kinase